MCVITSMLNIDFLGWSKKSFITELQTEACCNDIKKLENEMCMWRCYTRIKRWLTYEPGFTSANISCYYVAILLCCLDDLVFCIRALHGRSKNWLRGVSKALADEPRSHKLPSVISVDIRKNILPCVCYSFHVKGWLSRMIQEVFYNRIANRSML